MKIGTWSVEHRGGEWGQDWTQTGDKYLMMLTGHIRDVGARTANWTDLEELRKLAKTHRIDLD